MRPDQIYEALEQDRADLGLVSYPAATRELRAIDWRLEKMVFVCHPSHPLAGEKAIKPSDLGRTDFVSFDRGLQIRRALDRFFREHGVQREVAYEFDNIQMIKEALSIGQGVVSCRNGPSGRKLRRGVWWRFRLRRKGWCGRWGSCYSAARSFRPKARCFWSFCGSGRLRSSVLSQSSVSERPPARAACRQSRSREGAVCPGCLKDLRRYRRLTSLCEKAELPFGSPNI